MEGLYLGNIAPYGYKIKPLKKGNTLEKDDDEYKVLQIMVNKFDVNFGTGKVANYLNSLCIKPRKADRWTDAAVRGILKNYDTYLDNAGIDAQDKSIIDRCVEEVYKDYQKGGKVPTLCVLREKE